METAKDNGCDAMAPVAAEFSPGMAKIEMLDNLAFASLRDFFNHARLIQEELDAQPYVCRACMSKFSRGALKAHAAQMQCPACGTVPLVPLETALRMDAEDEAAKLGFALRKYRESSGAIGEAIAELERVAGIGANKSDAAHVRNIKRHADKLCACLESIIDTHRLTLATKRKISPDRKKAISFAQQAIASYHENIK